LRIKLGVPKQDTIVLCVARLSAEKGVEVFVESLSLVTRWGCPVHAVVVGDGLLRQRYVTLAESLGLSTRITFTGFREDVRPYYELASLCVLPSYKEGLPLVLLEAMAFGLPCIATDVGGNREIISDGVDGLIVPPGSAEELGTAIRRLIENEQERVAIAGRARRRIEKSFDLAVTVRRIQNALLGCEG
jgi:glycosyltransferase involved in cell wall biosynthesis